MGLPWAFFNLGPICKKGESSRGRSKDHSLSGFVALRIALQFLLQKFPESLLFRFTHLSVVGAFQFVDLLGQL